MKQNRIVATILLLPILISAGCSTIFAGSSQSIAVDSNPPDARCDLVREGKIIGAVEHTPGAVTIKKNKYDINIICRKDGYMESKQYADSGFENVGFVNFAFGIAGLIGFGIDSIAGADNKYPENITVSMLPSASSARASLSVPASSDSSPAASPALDVKRRIETLEQLKKDGILTEEEYKKKRAEALQSL